jgi:hypothetical protein
VSCHCDDDGGCGCLLLILLACALGGGWKAVAALGGGWLLYLVFIGVSLGIVAVIVKAIAGKD